MLDAGCGTGRLTAELLEALPRGRVVGVDLSQNMLGTAREHLKKDVGGRLNLVAADFLHLPFEKAFDGIVSTAAFHWVLDYDQLFLNLRRALIPGGWLEAQCGGGPNIAALRRRADALGAAPKYSRYFAEFREPWRYQSAEDAAVLMRRAGFEDVETSIEAAPTVLKNAAEFSEFLRNIIFRRHVEQLPAENLRHDFIEELTAQSATDETPFLLDYWRLNLRGRA